MANKFENSASQPPSLHSQLATNQLWEAAAFFAKAAFLFFLTPVMLRQWGSAGYGEFAVASSVMIFVSLFDLGLRGRARVELCHAVGSGQSIVQDRILPQAIIRFIGIAVFILLPVFVLAANGLWSAFLNLPKGHDRLIVITAICTQVYMLSGFFLEPLAARGRIGTMKMFGALGAASAIPAVWQVLQSSGNVEVVICTWLGCLTAANFLAILITGIWREVPHWKWKIGHLGGGSETWFSGIWFNVTSAAWLAKNHGLTFLVAFLAGPAAAGTFFIVLRLSEIVGSFGSISCDVALGGMSTGDLPHRQRVFATAYSYAAIFCLLLALGIGLFTAAFWQFWLHAAAPLGWVTGWLAALLGLASGFNRIIIFVAMALGIIQRAAFWSVVEAILALVGAWMFYHWWGLEGVLWAAALAVLALYPVASRICHMLDQPFWKIWRPRFSILFGQNNG